MGVLTGEFTDEEIEKLKSLQGTSRSEFQARYLELNDAYNQYQKDAGQIEDEIRFLSGDIELQKNELNASRDMGKAQDAADAILDAASKEALGLMMQEAKKNKKRSLKRLKRKRKNSRRKLTRLRKEMKSRKKLSKKLQKQLNLTRISA